MNERVDIWLTVANDQSSIGINHLLFEPDLIKVLTVCLKTVIQAVSDLTMESDLKLDQLETFLGKLNNKGQSFQNMT